MMTNKEGVYFVLSLFIVLIILLTPIAFAWHEIAQSPDYVLFGLGLCAGIAAGVSAVVSVLTWSDRL